MPIYEYECDACSHVFEQLIFSSDAEPSVCPECGKKCVKRLMSCSCLIGQGGGNDCAPAGTGGFS